MPPFRFDGSKDTPYPWGTVRPGDIAYFAGRAPNGDWSPVTAEATPEPDAVTADDAIVDETETAAATADEGSAESLRQPNKAASADDWKAYAIDHGGFEQATGVHPDDATRKAIVDHYTDGGEQ